MKNIRVGVVGIKRGSGFARNAGHVGMELVALCDTLEERLLNLGKELNVATYTDYDKFLEHDMDAVILANYFHQHAPFAVKALEAGKHVMSETASNTTLAEGVALCRTVEKTSKIYMLAENYPYTVFNQEMRRVYRTGEIGEVTYAEGEYNHPMAPRARLRISPGMKHWRAWIPSTYYCTHALAPLMCITDTIPVKVNGLSIACRQVDELTVRVADPGSVMLCRMDNGAVFRIFGLLLPGHSNWYRVHGSRGAMEIVRGPGYFGPGGVRVWHEEWRRANRVDQASPAPGDMAPAPVLAGFDADERQARAGLGQVQLGAFRVPENARAVWRKLQQENAALLGNLRPRIDVVDGGTARELHLLRVSPVMTLEMARSICSQLLDRSIDCLVVAPPRRLALRGEIKRFR